MACPCLSRHVEDRIVELDDRRTALPWYAWRRRRALTLRLAALMDVMFAAIAAESAE